MQQNKSLIATLSLFFVKSGEHNQAQFRWKVPIQTAVDEKAGEAIEDFPIGEYGRRKQSNQYQLFGRGRIDSFFASDRLSFQ